MVNPTDLLFVIGAARPFRDRIVEELRARGLGARPVESESAAGVPPGSAWLVLPALATGGLRPRLEDCAALLRVVVAAEPARLVLLSSSAAGGTGPRHTGMIAEQAPVRRGGARGVATAWRELERLAARSAPKCALAVVRVPSVAARGAPGLFDRLCSGGARVPVGRDPMIQLLAPGDLAAAIALVLRAGSGDTFHVVPRAVIGLRRAAALAGSAEVPETRATARGDGRADPEERVYLAHAWTASGARIAERLGFVARRSSLEALQQAIDPAATGPEPDAESDPDPFGLDAGLVDRLGRGLFGLLHDRYWRVETSGLEHLPGAGPVVLIGIHRGFVPFDAMMLLHLIRQRLGRMARFLVHPGLARAPFVSRLIPAIGGVPACRENADRLLGAGEIVGVFPEGVEGAFRPLRGAYRLGRFRDDFVAMARRHRAPIVPVVTVGTAEVFPVFARLGWRWWRRRTDWPCLPLSHGLLLPLPLPTKWTTRILPPVEAAESDVAGAAGDREIAQAVRATMQAALDELVERRRGWFTS